MRLAIAAVAVGVLACACASGGTQISGERRNVGGITMTFRIEPTRVQAGQNVRLTLRLVNNAGTPQKLTFNSGQLYDFWVDRNDKEVWRWSEERVFTQQVTERTIDGQTSMSFSESWAAAGRGSYRAHAKLIAEGFDRALEGDLTVE